MNSSILYSLLDIVSVLLSIAFFTLIERNIMAGSHNRNGPNNTTMNGVIQPMSDALKLLSNEWVKLNSTNKTLTFASPIIGVTTYLLLWVVVPNPVCISIIMLGGLYLVAILSTSIIFLINTGWASNSKYSSLGSYRATAQVISYEVSLAIIILGLLILLTGLDLGKLNEINLSSNMIMIPFLAAWILTCLAETNNTPFDFTEGESELVSGFNTEFYGSLFSIIFIAEYCAVIFIIFVSVTLYLTGNTNLATTAVAGILVVITLLRITMPRTRYDKLISMAWLSAIPAAILILVIVTPS